MEQHHPTMRMSLGHGGRSRRRRITVSTESLIMLCMIGVMEGQDISAADIQGAFLQTDYYKGDIYTKMEGGRATIL